MAKKRRSAARQRKNSSANNAVTQKDSAMIEDVEFEESPDL